MEIAIIPVMVQVNSTVKTGVLVSALLALRHMIVLTVIVLTLETEQVISLAFLHAMQHAYLN